MTTFQENLCSCPQCGKQSHAGSGLIEVSQIRNLGGEWVRWTRCSFCHATSRQVYDYAEHRFGQVWLINRSVP